MTKKQAKVPGGSFSAVQVEALGEMIERAAAGDHDDLADEVQAMHGILATWAGDYADEGKHREALLCHFVAQLATAVMWLAVGRGDKAQPQDSD